jgi:CRP/FNR family cyclic AMP-dependent transcriptional regulator
MTSAFAGGWRPATLLGQLPGPERAELLSLGTEHDYPAGGVLMFQDDSRRDALLLLSGYAKVTAAAEGHTVLLAIRAQGDVVGEPAAPTHAATIIACTPVVARTVPLMALADYLVRRPAVGDLLKALVMTELTGANRRRDEFATLTIRERLARVTVELAELCGSPVLPAWITEADLADLIDAPVASVPAALRSL